MKRHFSMVIPLMFKMSMTTCNPNVENYLSHDVKMLRILNYLTMEYYNCIVTRGGMYGKI